MDIYIRRMKRNSLVREITASPYSVIEAKSESCTSHARSGLTEIQGLCHGFDMGDFGGLICLFLLVIPLYVSG
jgi:hypothetical protein